MKPTKAKELIKKTASELNVPEFLVQDVVDFYYTLVRRKLESLQYPTLYLHKIGTIRLSRVKLKNSITRLEKLLTSNNQEDFKKVIKYNLTKEMLVIQKEGLKICNNHYEPLYEKRNKNLESQRADIGGDQEQHIQD